MEFRILGPLEVRVGGRRIALGGPQPGKLLAALLLARGRVVSLDALTDALWDAEPPPTAKHQVHKVIGKLRATLPGVIETDGPGYRVCLDDATVDAGIFTDRAAEGTVTALTEALALWRGPALDGIDGRVLRAGATALDEQRLAVLEELTELRLDAGETGALAVELPAVVAAHPYRETLRGQLMTALYRSGRQADALAVYDQTRALFMEELGVEPGPELAALHHRLLRADPALAQTKGPCTLPYDVADFAGRSAELERVLAASAAGNVTAIDGMAGVGKTALAVHIGHRLAGQYPHGQLFYDLRGHTPGAQPVEPETAVQQLLGMLGVPGESVPEGLGPRVARWRAELADRKVLLVLDNAASAAQVRPLLPGGTGCLVLITSRRRLGVLDGAAVQSLDVLPSADALALFGNVVGVPRAVSEPDAAAEVVALCGYLPLAIRIAATRLAHRPMWTVVDLASRLRAGLEQFALEDRGVGAAFALSYQQLDADEQRMLELLGLHPGTEFEPYSVAALANVAPLHAEDLMERLVDAHLLVPRASGRYTFHDLVRHFARELPGDSAEPLARLHDYYLAVTTTAADLISPEARRFEPSITRPPVHAPELADLDAGLAWLAAEHGTLLAIAEADDGWQLACVLRAYFEHRGHYAQWRATHEKALRCATGDPRATTLLEFNLAAVAMWTDQPADGMAHLRRALASNLDDEPLRATILTNLGMLAHQLFRDDEAAAYVRAALGIEHDNPRVTALGWNNLALTEGRTGHGEQAMAHHRQALALARRHDIPTAERGILLGMGETALRLGVPAVTPFREALELARAGRFRMQEALALDGLAHATGDPAYWREALAILTDLGVDRAGLVRRHLADPAARSCDLCRAAHPQHAARITSAGTRR